MKAKLLNGLNNFLVFDTFLVLLSALWLVVGLMGRTVGLPLGLNLWYKLWPILFTPAIGIFILGGLVSSAISQIRKRRLFSQ